MLGKLPEPTPAREFALFLGIVLLCYGPAIYGGFVWDDASLLTGLLDEPGALWRAWFAPRSFGSEEHYWPVTYTIFWVQRKLWGNWPGGYHLLNILLHVLNTWLCVRIARRLALPGAALGGILFAVHPVHVQSVAWIIELKDVLSGAFCLAAILVFTRTQIAGRDAVLFLACALLAVLSKSVAVVLPITCAILIWWRRELRTRPHAALTMAAFAICAIYAWFDVQFAHSKGTAGVGVAIPMATRLLIAARAFVFYLSSLLFPHPLMAIFPKWHLGPELTYIAIALALVLSMILTFLGARGMRGTLAALGNYVAWLAPTLGLVQYSYMQYSYVADRYQYLASAPMVLLAAAGITELWRRASKPAQAGIATLGAAAVIALAAVTMYQGSLYWSTERLFRHNALHNPKSADVRNYLATGLAEHGNWTEAAKELAVATELRPDDLMLLRNWITAVWQSGNVDRAMELANAAVRRFSSDQKLKELQHAIYMDYIRAHPTTGNTPTPVGPGRPLLGPGRG